jgi:hypothetical protein
MIRRVKQLVRDQGIMFSHNPKRDKTLNAVTEDVKSFHKSEKKVVP